MSPTVEEIKKHQIEDDTVPVTDSHQIAARLERLLDDRRILLAMLDAQATSYEDAIAKFMGSHGDSFPFYNREHARDLLLRFLRNFNPGRAALSPVGAVVGREESFTQILDDAQLSPGSTDLQFMHAWNSCIGYIRERLAGALPPPDAGQPGAVSGAENAAGGVVGSADEGVGK